MGNVRIHRTWPGLLLLLATCHHGGGSGGAGPAPHLASASFYGSDGSDTQPDAGEKLRLSFDLPVQIRNGVTFNQDDMALSGAGTPGTGLLQLTQVNPLTVDVTLGPGVDFTPGATTVDLTAGQDALVASGGTPAGPAQPVRIRAGTPEIQTFTVAAIPAELSGQGIAGGTLLVPTLEFPVDLEWRDRDGGSVVPASLHLGATVAVGSTQGELGAGTNLAPFFTQEGLSAGGVRLVAGSQLTFPNRYFVLWATVGDDQDKTSPRAAMELVAAEATPELRPFETVVHPRQTWHVDLTRDRQTIAFSGVGTITIEVTAGPNGTPDFREDLLGLGLGSATPLFDDLGDGTHPNDFLAGLVSQSMMDTLVEIFADVRVEFTTLTPGGPLPQLQVPYDQFSFSRIAVGGAADNSALGLALMDERNEHQDDDSAWPGSIPSFGVALGVFSTELALFSINALPTIPFRQTFDQFIPGRGTPVGEGGDDRDSLRFLAGLATLNPDPLRTERIDRACRELGTFLAVVLAHEMGHSMGLVQDGAPPTGLYGDLAGSFPGSNSGHIDLTQSGLYPPLSQNIMAPAISFLYCQSASTRFNPLNQAWLREQVLYVGTLPGRIPNK